MSRAAQRSIGPSSRVQAALFLRALVLLSVAAASLRVGTATQVGSWLARRRTTPHPPAERLSAGEIARTVTRAARLLPGVTCLPIALVTHALLREHGVSGDVRIGWGRDASSAVSGHALVCVGDDVVVGGPLRPEQRDASFSLLRG